MRTRAAGSSRSSQEFGPRSPKTCARGGGQDVFLVVASTTPHPGSGSKDSETINSKRVESLGGYFLFANGESITLDLVEIHLFT